MLPFRHLPPNLAREVFAHLCDCLPPPRDDTPEARDARDMIAMTEVVGYDPIDMIEAMLAVRIVASEAHARDALRLVAADRNDFRHVRSCRAQAAMMMRTADKARVELRACRKERPAIANAGTRPIATATFVPAATVPVAIVDPATVPVATVPTATPEPEPAPSPVAAIRITPSATPTRRDPDPADTDAELCAVLAGRNPQDQGRKHIDTHAA